jgi:bacillopeptidase F
VEAFPSNDFFVDEVRSIYRQPSPTGHSNSTTHLEFKEPSSSSLAWNIKRVGADQCWSQGVNGSGVVIATIDGGVRYTHVALRDSYRGSSLNGRNYEYTHDYNWIDYAYGDAEPFDSDGHGTNVQGVCSGSADSGVGMAPGSKWIAAKVFNYAGASSEDDLIASTQWVMCPTPVGKSSPEDCSQGADVVSCSWGFASTYAPTFQQYINAWTAAEMVPVFAVGNYGPNCETIAAPSDFEGVIGVGGTDDKDRVISFSSRGPVEGMSGYSKYVPAITAPGMSIYGPSCDSDTTYVGYSGTSQAAPHVAGAMALIMSANPTLSIEELYNILLSSSNQESLLEPNDGENSCGGIAWNTFPNYIYGYGRLDALAAVNQAKTGLE